jgi:peptide subunit release factor 1 (eRF1)
MGDKLNVEGIIFAGPGNLKDLLSKDIQLDEKIKAKLLGIVEIGYGGKVGLNEAIRKSTQLLKNAQICQEKEVLTKFMQSLADDDHLAVIGIQEINYALSQNAVKTILIHKEMEQNYLIIDHKDSGPQFIQQKDAKEKQCISIAHYVCTSTKINWIYLTSETSETQQFNKGLGGLGAILSWPLLLPQDEIEESSDVECFDD